MQGKSMTQPLRAGTSRSTESGAEDKDRVAWVNQATRARDAAFRLAHDRFIKGLDAAARLVHRTDPNAVASAMEYADKLTAEYLTESNKLFQLTSKFVQDGPHETRDRTRGSDIPNARERS
jgi:hypothetical protein